MRSSHDGNAARSRWQAPKFGPRNVVGMIEDLHVTTVEALAPDQPVVMLNLMKFYDKSLDGDGSGWDAYLRYSKLANKCIRDRGARIVWAGEVNGASLGPEVHGDWDFTALVTYPTPDAFLAMLRSEEYQIANGHRENGCAAHLIMAVNETFNGLAG